MNPEEILVEIGKKLANKLANKTGYLSIS